MIQRTLLFALSVLGLPVAAGLAGDEPAKPPPTISWEDAGAHIGEECLVVGQVVMTRNIGSMCFLNFHRDFRNHFTAVIKRENFDRFPEPPEILYADKHVSIRGELIDYQGKPEIIVTHPDQITIVDGAEERPPPGVGEPARPAAPPAAAKAAPTPPATKATAAAFDGTVTVASYNVLNLFDDHDDPYHRDEGTPAKPSAELENLAATFRNVNADVIALQEVENRGFLERFNKTMLSDLGYEHVVLFEGNDRRGIDVAVLSRLPVGPVTSYRHVTYRNPDGRTARFRRDLIRVRIEPPGGQSFDVFVVHLKSKHGGEASTVIRLGEATAARLVLDEVLRDDPEARFVLCGDLNDTFDSAPVGALIGSGPTALRCFYDEVSEDERITFNKEPYRSMIDFMLCSPAMARRHEPGSYRVLPGTVETSGSDHNPISARFRLK